MHKNVFIISSITAFILLGCGGSTIPSNTPTAAISKISGTVPGTLIEAFCEDGTYAQVSSTQNGTNAHPFEIEIPQNTNCKLVMTTNENDPEARVITPIGFIKSAVTGTTISISGDIDLSHIPLELDYNNANDADGDHVVDETLQVLLDNTSNTSINNTAVHDTNKDGRIDAYEDDDDDGTVNAYEDDDDDGTDNIHDDDDEDGTPDYLEDEDEDDEDNDDDDDDDYDDDRDN